MSVSVLSGAGRDSVCPFSNSFGIPAMNILITGGTGRVGANLARRLLAAGHNVRAFVYPGDAGRAGKLAGFERVETIEGDLRSFADCQQAVDGMDAVYHLAAAFGGPFDNRDYLAINGGGTLNLLEAVRDQCPNLHRFVYACTEAIYWHLTDRSPHLEGRESRYFANAIRETDVSPYLQMPYFLTKYVGEQLVMSYHHQYGVPSVSFRFTTIIEPSEFLNADGLPPLFLLSSAHQDWSDQHSPDPAEQAMLDHIRSLWTGEEKLLLSLNPNGVPFRQHYTDVRDIALGLSLALDAEAAVGQEMNLGGAAILDWAELVPWLAERHDMEYVTAKIPSPNYFELDLGKTRSILGYEPEHDFHSILATAEAMARGEQTDVIPTGVRWQARSEA
ncbi:MAG: NAD(P)-dependent oxidoreductase [Caldilineaceae bacterium SB0666_bin_21]|nr:NAD(P)-dependent oxidoreductase [Caldilineaceae bacterium SB0666_bin_21]